MTSITFYNREFYRWQEMQASCYDKSYPSYNFNGRLGVTVCERWKDFFNFLADVGTMPGYNSLLDRVPGSAVFDKNTTKWREGKERKLTYGNVTKTITEWSKELKVAKGTIASRLRKNLAVHSVLAPRGLSRHDLSGVRYGMLLVTTPKNTRFSHDMWRVKCDCGSIFTIAAKMLQTNKIKSCGCVPSRNVKLCPSVLMHEGRTRTLMQWQAACGVPAKEIAARIRRGLTVDQALGYEEIPVRMQGTKQMSLRSGLKESTIRNRRNINVHPDDLLNSRSLDKAKMYTMDGFTMSLGSWAEFLEVNLDTIRARLHRGWSIEEALKIPVEGHGNNSSDRR